MPADQPQRVPPHATRRPQGEGPVQGRAADRVAADAPAITVNGREVVNFCANNYLGLANHPDIVDAAHDGLKTWGYGLSSACGSSAARRTSTSGCEQQIAKFFGKDDSILYISCFDANGGLFEPLLDRAGRDPLRRTEPRLASSTACGSARRSGSATSTTTWPT